MELITILSLLTLAETIVYSILIWQQRKSYEKLFNLYMQGHKEYLELTLKYFEAIEDYEEARKIKTLLESYNNDQTH